MTTSEKYNTNLRTFVSKYDASQWLPQSGFNYRIQPCIYPNHAMAYLLYFKSVSIRWNLYWCLLLLKKTYHHRNSGKNFYREFYDVCICISDSLWICLRPSYTSTCTLLHIAASISQLWEKAWIYIHRLANKLNFQFDSKMMLV